MDALRIILFAADFSDNSIAAFRAACSLSLEKTTRLIVLHVVEPEWATKRADYLGLASFAPSETESLRESLKRRLSEVYAPAHAFDVECRTSDGTAANEIVHIADLPGRRAVRECPCDTRVLHHELLACSKNRKRANCHETPDPDHIPQHAARRGH
jgi:Universal stress protein family